MYNFVVECSDGQLVEFRKISSIEEYQREQPSESARILAYTWVWCLQAYVNLKSRGDIPVMLSNKYDKRYINVAHSNTLIVIPGKASEFIVCIQADFTYRSWAHFHVVQNKSQLITNSAFVPLWVQPGLMRRDINRSGVQRVAYAGQTFNNNLAGTTQNWIELLNPYGIEFTVVPNDTWHDMRAIDILVGVRSFDLKPYDKKPPSKLINAWHAEIPFIGGHDSAYKQVGEPEKDYLLVQTPEETLQAIKRLRDDPQLYDKLVCNGKVKALLYTEECILDMWEDLLNGPVMRRYEKWKDYNKLECIRFVIMQSIGLQKHRVKQIVRKILQIIGYTYNN